MRSSRDNCNQNYRATPRSRLGRILAGTTALTAVVFATAAFAQDPAATQSAANESGAAAGAKGMSLS